MSIHILFLIVAVLCFLLKGFGVNTGRVDLWPIGWAFVVASLII